MTNLWGDLRYAFRSLRKAPVFTAVAVLSLALGIGANTAIFTLLDQILLRLLPVKDAKELVLLTMRGRHYGSNWGGNAISYPMYRDFQDRNQVFSAMFCRFPRQMSVAFDGHTELITAEIVSGTYFPVLGVGALLGRTLNENDDRTIGGHPVAVLAYDYWKNRFAGDPAVVGKKIVINGNNFTIVGVSKEGFDGVELGNAAKLFAPMMMQHDLMPDNKFLKDRRTRFVNAFGRLKPGVTQAEAKASLQPIMHAMLEQEVQEPAFSNASEFTRKEFLKNTIDVLPGSQGRSFFRQDLTTPLWVLMAITGTVLLIACANLANLLLARATGRYKEMAIRLAMGAGRGRIISQLLTESLVLAFLGGAAGILLAFWADRLLMAAYLPSDSTGLEDCDHARFADPAVVHAHRRDRFHGVVIRIGAGLAGDETGHRAYVEGSGGRGGGRRKFGAAKRPGHRTGDALSAAADRRGVVCEELEQFTLPGSGIPGGETDRIRNRSEIERLQPGTHQAVLQKTDGCDWRGAGCAIGRVGVTADSLG